MKEGRDIATKSGAKAPRQTDDALGSLPPRISPRNFSTSLPELLRLFTGSSNAQPLNAPQPESHQVGFLARIDLQDRERSFPALIYKPENGPSPQIDGLCLFTSCFRWISGQLTPFRTVNVPSRQPRLNYIPALEPFIIPPLFLEVEKPCRDHSSPISFCRNKSCSTTCFPEETAQS
ncbi:uncharacterized protein K444DRAFT_194950 [Hyaloscypha bicolor E]|uniref:Uncharacterized protein n=1 Tax=Hyaloscypha bicolor E TaxID=1095630 RepID=A0A2J6SQB4_9HELO|nr:uncharacterized protein K444DRAFT_194950 [Hyaloscypha bicolor E]PMD52958.1 hypothetical protein K444DRAFT_194950 [Hyaloscypha bicolor E]